MQSQGPIEARFIYSHDFLICRTFQQALDLDSSDVALFANIILGLWGRNATWAARLTMARTQLKCLEQEVIPPEIPETSFTCQFGIKIRLKVKEIYIIWPN